ncbi:hypothetical protein [Lacrimispora xylanisolvens]|uniref:hypothetical protein n=1 Tax=Lacrimispora xylanisolvens TaxID=384636 RepID=UPI002402D269
MAKQEIGYRANMGTPTLILIFMILCLVTFGMLSLSTAKKRMESGTEECRFCCRVLQGR